MKTILAWIAGIAAVFAVMFGLNVMGMFGKSFFGKWNEQIRYDIHKESQTYRDGMQRTLDGLMNEFRKADTVGKIGIKETIRHQFSQTDVSRLPAYQRDFLSTEIGIY
ncbi:hypothetical protein MHM88_14190 [Epibacterium sp. MM17-32]|uniref:hypothetical protein n=1 Tax=Epibacterium sp. MM17-32 TaxID=2917734 RepID=UPI001EF71327|nr:hypothetical protein [Epibacterium sp. MM17-32]MCG7628957.1 hypothetical protein [Epibacterium sp. MM17-32]